ncbi:MAG: FISUMP domain-containing protein [Candidatus Gracilibacteria bacterium]|nr:FISUMP domain-containing protein [Candidatus Gracilibacteria bacterium]
MKKQAFTLVELIVVITILAILGTIAFINLQGYSSGARDSKRLSDINNIQKKITIEISKGTPLSSLLNLVKTNSGLIIDGINTATSIQGIANFQNLKENGESFKDPVTKGDYVLSYSVGGAGTGAYKFVQISTINEELNQAVVKGNYYIIQTGDSPSIIVNNEDYYVVDEGVDLPYIAVVGGSLATFTCGDTVSAGGYTYTTLLGPDGKCWTSTNMKHGTMLVNGTTMPSDTNTIEKWCYNNDINICNTDGGLYTWSEAMGFPASCNTISCAQSEDTTKSVCGQLGTGWNLPTDAQLYNLENLSTTNGQTCISTRINSRDCSGAGWAGNKLSGIISVLSGNRNNFGNFIDISTYGGRLSSSESSTSNSQYRRLYSGLKTNRGGILKVYGSSVICIKN